MNIDPHTGDDEDDEDDGENLYFQDQ